MNTKHNILICPLEWGLGHAARMIPLARRLSESGNNVILASGDEHLNLLRTELPGLTTVRFHGFSPGYSKSIPQYIWLLFKLPGLFYHIASEHLRLKKLIREYNIDIVISDNRFGLWNKHVTSVYVTHMLLIPLPHALKALEPAGAFIHRLIINRYDFCFIPDLPGELNLSGRLSHGMNLPGNARYIGILSRFSNPADTSINKHFLSLHRTVILSGPEPQRSMLKDKLISVLKNNNTLTIIFEGKPGTDNNFPQDPNIISHSHLPEILMREIIQNSELIITRSGYTTLMELVSMNCSALLIPTPGQTEQEYLAESLSEKGWFASFRQKEIKTGMPLIQGKVTYADEINNQSRRLLNQALAELSESHHKKY